MELLIRIYTDDNGSTGTQQILFGESELEEMISRHLRDEDYLATNQTITSISYEQVTL
jgi:hypothetical protein